MRYHLVEGKELYYWEFGQYDARKCWYVQESFLFFFRRNLRRFWDEDLAKSYLKALIELSR